MIFVRHFTDVKQCTSKDLNKFFVEYRNKSSSEQTAMEIAS